MFVGDNRRFDDVTVLPMHEITILYAHVCTKYAQSV